MTKQQVLFSCSENRHQVCWAADQAGAEQRSVSGDCMRVSERLCCQDPFVYI